MLKKVLANSMIYGLGQNVPKLISLVLIPVITPFLTKEDYGIYGILLAYIGSTTVLKQLGFSVILSNSFFKNPLHYKFVWSRVFGFLLTWNLILALIYTILIPIVIPSTAKENLFIIIIMYVIPTIFFDTIVFFGNKFLHYSQKAISFCIITLIKSIIGYVVLYISVVKFNQGYLGWLYSTFAISFLGALLLGYELLVNKLYPNFNFNYKWLRKKLKIALPVIPHFYSVFLLTNSDRIMMDLFGLSLDKIGEYSLAYQVASYFSLAGVALGMAYGPIIMQMIKNNQGNKIKEITKILSIVFITGAFIVSLWMQDIFKVLVRNETLQSAYSIATVVVFSFTYYPIYYYVNTYLQYVEKTMYLLKISFTSGVLNILMNLFMIPYFGITGAAISTFICYMYLGYSGLILKKFLSYDRNAIKYLFYVPVTIFLFCISISINSLTWKVLLSLLVMIFSFIFILKIRINSNEVFN